MNFIRVNEVLIFDLNDYYRKWYRIDQDIWRFYFSWLFFSLIQIKNERM